MAPAVAAVTAALGCMVYCVIVNDVRGVRFAVTEFEIASKVQKKEVIYIYI